MRYLEQQSSNIKYQLDVVTKRFRFYILKSCFAEDNLLNMTFRLCFK